LTADNSVFPYSNANDMRVTQDLNSFGEIIAHVHCSVDEKNDIVSSSNFLESFCNLSANDEYMSDCEIAPTTANASTKTI
jgi:hypothetical protein